MSEYADVIFVDDEDVLDYEGYPRNATRDHRRTASPVSSGGSRPRRGRAIIRTSGTSLSGRRRANAGSIVRRDTGGLSMGQLFEAGAQVLAAIQSLPTPPVATGTVATDMSNLMLYQTALAEHAKRDEQIRTVGSLASKFFA